MGSLHRYDAPGCHSILVGRGGRGRVANVDPGANRRAAAPGRPQRTRLVAILFFGAFVDVFFAVFAATLFTLAGFCRVDDT